MSDEKFVIEDEKGNKIECTILFTYQSDRFEKNYVFFIPSAFNEADEVEVSIAEYNEKGALFPVATEEEWEELEKVLAEYAEGDGEDEE